LVANANGFFFDATVASKRALYHAPRAGGPASLVFELADGASSLTPPFVSDGAYLYTRAAAPADDALALILTSSDDAGATVMGRDTFDAAASHSMTANGDFVFVASGSVELRVMAKSSQSGASGSAPAPGHFSLPGCSPDFGSIVAAGDSALFLGCIGADLSFNAIYRVPLPAAWLDGSAASDASMSSQVVEVVSGTSINHAAFLAHGTDLYYSSEADPALFRVSSSGGAKTKIMATHGVKHLAATSTDVYVLSACGLQQAGL
jgi:hypothetical protein